MLVSGAPRVRFSLLALAILMVGAALLSFTSSRASAASVASAEAAGHGVTTSGDAVLVKAGRPDKERPSSGDDPTAGDDPKQAKEDARLEKRCTAAEDAVKDARKVVKKKKKKKNKAPRGKKKKKAKRQLRAAKANLSQAEDRAEVYCSA
ncbi:MAG: hypothetical protein KDB62_06120 [Solirubrobacterales bacterium]|nr:hypothetical protein [Solirubrobacterales bacterium]